MKNSLKLFSRTSERDTFNLASYHSPHSLTWRWIVSFYRPRLDRGRWRPMWNLLRHNSGGQAYFGMLKLGFRFHWQRPMWFRDLYMSKRDEEDHARYQRSTFDYAAQQPDVTEGSKALH